MHTATEKISDNTSTTVRSKAIVLSGSTTNRPLLRNDPDKHQYHKKRPSENSDACVGPVIS